METNYDKTAQLGDRIDEIRAILAKYPASSENVSLLTFHLYELLKCNEKYVSYFKNLLTLPTDREHELDQLLDTLIGVKVLLEDAEYHSAELRGQIDKYSDTAETDP